jgi:hypothetical protein
MHKLRPVDYIIFLLSLFIIFLSSVFSIQHNKGELSAVIEASGKNYIYPVSENNTITVTGPVGKTVISINDNQVYISDSDCRDKICLSMGKLSKPGQWAACLPNRVFVRIITKSPEISGNNVDDGTF